MRRPAAAAGAGSVAADPPRHWVVPPEAGDERVDRALAVLAGVSRSRARALVEQGAVRVDGRAAARPSDRVAAGAELTVTEAMAESRAVEPDEQVEVAVVHEDRDLVVVDKAPGLVVHPAPGHRGPTLVAGLLARYPEMAGVGPPERPGVVHRLDKGTSGLMVVARRAAAHDGLVEAIAARRVTRRYDTMVTGTVEADAGLIDAPLGRDPRRPTRRAVVEGGRSARTRYEVTTRFGGPDPRTRLAVTLETGRTHQIRVHLASIGHAVVGDQTYGGPTVPGLDRPFLHATHLAFTHPVTGREVVVDSPLPPDLEAVL